MARFVSWRAGFLTSDNTILVHTPVDIPQGGTRAEYYSGYTSARGIAWSSTNAHAVNPAVKLLHFLALVKMNTTRFAGKRDCQCFPWHDGWARRWHTASCQPVAQMRSL